MQRLRLLLTTFLFLIMALPGRSQPAGLPFIQHYAPNTYHAHPESRAIIQDSQGILYVGNQHGLLAFDGSTWKLTEVPGQAVRALAIDSTNTIYIGTDTNFGYLNVDDRGRKRYVSLSDKLPSDQSSTLKTTWIACADGRVYFGTSQAIYSYQPGHELRNWKTPEGFRHASFVQHTLIVQTKTGQILKANSAPTANHAGQFVSLPGTDRLIHERVEAILPYSGNRLLFVTCQGGLFVYNNQRNTLIPLPTQVDDWLHRARVFRAIYIPNGMAYRYAIGSAREGVRILDDQGREVQRINESNGLHRNAVLSLFYDREKSLWVGTGSGLDRIEINLPISRFASSLNVRSTVRAIRRHEGTLYIGTGLGLYGWDETTHQFEAVNGTDASCWSLLTEGPDLWAGGSGFIWRVRQNRIAQKLVTNDEPILALLRPRRYANYLLAASSSGIRLYRREKDSWTYAGNLTGIHDECLALAEAKDGTIWIGTHRAGFYRIDPASDLRLDTPVQHFTTASGLASTNWNHVFTTSLGLRFTADGQLYTFQQAANRFAVDATFGPVLKGLRADAPYLAEGKNHSLWFANPPVVFRPETGGKWQADTLSLKPILQGGYVVYPEANGLVWLGNDEGL